MALEEKRIQIFRLMITTINEFRLITENKLKQYIGQCDTLRRESTCNEEYWHDMMKNKVKISFDDFIKNVNFDKLLDNGESIKDYIDNAIKTDADTAAYTSNWGDKDCIFLQTAGFEFIFI